MLELKKIRLQLSLSEAAVRNLKSEAALAGLPVSAFVVLLLGAYVRGQLDPGLLGLKNEMIVMEDEA